MKINIVTGPFGALPPYAIGAVERCWYSVGCYWLDNGYDVKFISKQPKNGIKQDNHIYIKGYERTGSWTKDALLDFIYSFKALKNACKSDIIILNTIWTPILYFLFKHKFRGAVYNVERFPKKQMFLYKAMNSLSCVSIAVYDALIEQTPTLKEKCCVIPNPIDTGIFQTDLKCRTVGAVPTIVYSGRIHREKGVDILASAVNILRKEYNIRLRIIGAWDIGRGGSGKEYVDEINKKAEGWNIEWIDPIYSPSELAKELDKGSIFCYPSLAEKGETFGVAPLEAMGVGLVPVVSELGCFRDFVRDKENGLYFNHKSVDRVFDLASKIRYLIENPKAYEEMSMQAIKTSKSFSVQNVANKYMNLFYEILNGKPISQKP